MRTYGRVNQVNGLGGTWIEVDPDVNGDVSMIQLTTLCQCLKLNLGESPFWADAGIPAQPSVFTQKYPDYNVMQTQQQFAGNFASLVINRVQASNPPSYTVQAVCFNGAILTATVAT